MFLSIRSHMFRVAVLAAIGWIGGIVHADLAAPPNIVLIVADDLGWADLGCYGADLHETPHLDRLAAEGVRFTNGYAASICSPSRASLLTGRHYARLQMTIWHESALKPPQDKKLVPPISVANLPYEEVTLAEVLQRSGYSTSLVGKWHLGDANFYPETQGFDINIGGTHWGAPQTFFYPYRGQGRFAGEFRYVPQLHGGQSGEYLTDRLTDEALKVIERAGRQPFFLYLAHHAPHTPIEAPAKLVAHYREKLRSEMTHQNPAYAAMVHALDQSVGRIVERLDVLGLSDRTVIVFVSDNGGFIGSFEGQRVTNNAPLRSGKGALYEGGVRVPLIIRAPGTRGAGSVCHEPVYVADLMPTLLDLAAQGRRAKAEPVVDGLSLTPLLDNPAAQLDREELYFHYPHYYPTTAPVGAIRSRDWKLLEFFEDQHVELYNLKQDEGESQDLASVEPQKAKSLRTRLEGWRQSMNVRMPGANPRFAD